MTFLMCGWPVVRAESLDGNALSNCSWESVFARSTTRTLPSFSNLLSAITAWTAALNLRRILYLRRFAQKWGSNYAYSLLDLQRFEEAKSLLRKAIPAARRVLGEGHRLALKMRRAYAQSLYKDAAATLDDLREAVNTLEDAGRTARQVLGGAHPLTEGIEGDLRRSSRAILTAATRK